jgi:GT2 family glycosyltransferase
MAPHDRPLVSVCIANYNGIDIIDACLRSVIDQDCGFAVEIIVHDDASTDGSPRRVRERFSDVILIESTQNVGFCVANNRMAHAATGEYILLLNNDAELFPDALRKLHAAAVAIGRPAILGLPQYDAQTGELIDIGSVFDPFLNPIPNLDRSRCDVGMIIGACFWLPRVLWHELGGFPAWFGSMAEDMYLSCAARLHGYPVRALPDSGFRHWVGKSFGGGKVIGDKKLVTSYKRRALSERNKSYVMVLTYPAPVFQLVFPLHLLLLLVEGALLSLAKRHGRLWRQVYAPCFCALWRNKTSLFALRRELQRERSMNCRDFFKAFTLLPHKLRMLFRYGLPEVG